MKRLWLGLTFLLSACLPQVQTPSPAPENFAAQKFTSECLAEGFTETDCDTYVFTPSTLVSETTVRISGESLKINADECVQLEPFTIKETLYERIRCNFSEVVKPLYVYLNGEDVLVITEYKYQDKMFYLPPLKLE